jgi:2,4-didehydro-3-deoxy-L-rhamnonate hydrolase
MRLFRLGQPHHERPAVSVGCEKLDVSEFGEDYNEAFFATDGIERLRKWTLEHGGACPVLDENERITPCVSRPSKIVCVGLRPKVLF